MSILMEQAAKGHKKSMLTLYNENKGKVFSFCSILLNDKEKAAAVTTDVFNNVWEVLEEKNILTEKKFREYLYAGAAKQCRSLMGVKELKNIKTAGKQAPTKVFSGDVAGGMEQLQAALKDVEPYLHYIFMLVNAGGMDYRDIAQLIRQKEIVAKNHYEAAVAAVADALAKKGSSLEVEQVKSLVEQAKKSITVPEAVDEACKAKMKECAKKPTLDKRLVPPLVVIAVCVVVVLIAGILEMRETAAQEKVQKVADQLGIELLEEDATYTVDIQIENYGTVSIEIDQEAAPITAANFVNLAINGFYDGLTFHRIMDGFMMQGGDPEGNGTGGSDTTIPGEFSENGYTNELSHTRGTVSMARSNDYDSASSQFFIMQEDNTGLDGKYAAFGHVTEGMDIVDAICADAEPTDGNGTITAEEQPVITYMLVKMKYK